MRSTRFWKLSGAGNDFILLRAEDLPRRSRLPALARRLCDRRLGIGADGILVLGAEVRYLNADGSAAFCGNGTRCAAWWLARRRGRPGELSFTSSGVRVRARADSRGARVRMPDPTGMRLGLRLKVLGRTIRADYVDTGVPHLVVAWKGLSRAPVAELGRALRRHAALGPGGANVNFLEGRRARTYERGVEAETLACGTGAVACSLTLAARRGLRSPLAIQTRGGTLTTSFRRRPDGAFDDVWLEGPVAETFCGEVGL